MEAKELREMSAEDLVQKSGQLARGNRPPEAEARHQPFGESDEAQRDQARFGSG